MTVIRSFLFCNINLPPPEGREEFLEGFAWLNEGLLLLAHVAIPRDTIDLESGYK